MSSKLIFWNELLGKSEFPSIHEQYISGYELRYRLDSTILEVLGFNPGEIRNTLDKLYKAIADELEGFGCYYDGYNIISGGIRFFMDAK